MRVVVSVARSNKRGSRPLCPSVEANNSNWLAAAGGLFWWSLSLSTWRSGVGRVAKLVEIGQRKDRRAWLSPSGGEVKVGG